MLLTLFAALGCVPWDPVGLPRDEWHAPIHFNSSNATNVIWNPFKQTV